MVLAITYLASHSFSEGWSPAIAFFDLSQPRAEKVAEVDFPWVKTSKVNQVLCVGDYLLSPYEYHRYYGA